MALCPSKMGKLCFDSAERYLSCVILPDLAFVLMLLQETMYNMLCNRKNTI